MHCLGAIEIENTENYRRITAGRNTSQRQTCDGAKILGDNAGLIGKVAVNTLDHEKGPIVYCNVSNNAPAGLEMRFQQTLSFTVESRCVTKRFSFASHDE